MANNLTDEVAEALRAVDAHDRYCDCSWGRGPLAECEREMGGKGCRAPEDHGPDGMGIPPKVGDECLKVRAAIAHYGDLCVKLGREEATVTPNKNCRHPFSETYTNGHTACLSCGDILVTP